MVSSRVPQHAERVITNAPTRRTRHRECSDPQYVSSRAFRHSARVIATAPTLSTCHSELAGEESRLPARLQITTRFLEPRKDTFSLSRYGTSRRTCTSSNAFSTNDRSSPKYFDSLDMRRFPHHNVKSSRQPSFSIDRTHDRSSSIADSRSTLLRLPAPFLR